MADVGESWVQLCPASVGRSTAILLTGNQEGNVNSVLVVSVGGVQGCTARSRGVTLELLSATGSPEPCCSWLHTVPCPKQKAGEGFDPSLVLERSHKSR